VSSWLSDRIGQKIIVLVATLTIPTFALLFLNAPPDWQMPMLAAAGVLAFSANPAFLALVQRHFPHERSLAHGAYMASGFVIRSLVVFMVRSCPTILALFGLYGRCLGCLPGFTAYSSLPGERQIQTPTLMIRP
jgi:MFS family permease